MSNVTLSVIAIIVADCLGSYYKSGR